MTDYLPKVADVPFLLGRPEDLPVLTLPVEDAVAVRELLGSPPSTIPGYLDSIRAARGSLTAIGTTPVGADPVESEANRDNDIAFGIVRTQGDPVPLLIRAALAAQTGALQQVPSSVSAVKVGGRRSYDRVRAGEEVELAPRSVTVHLIDLHGIRRPEPDLLDLDVTVSCTAGTYIRAIARDTGAALGVGGHLTTLRRTASGPFSVDRAAPVEEAGAALLAGGGSGFLGLTEAGTTVFPVRPVTQEEARALAHGQRIPATGTPGLHAAVDPGGRLAALLEDSGSTARVAVGFPPA